MALSNGAREPQKKVWRRPEVKSVTVQVPMNLMICTPPQQQCPADDGCFLNDCATECANSC